MVVVVVGILQASWDHSELHSFGTSLKSSCHPGILPPAHPGRSSTANPQTCTREGDSGRRKGKDGEEEQEQTLCNMACMHSGVGGISFPTTRSPACMAHTHRKTSSPTLPTQTHCLPPDRPQFLDRGPLPAGGREGGILASNSSMHLT